MIELEGKYASAKIFAKTVEEGAIKQIKDVLDHPIFKNCKIRIMPDCHIGKGCTIGFTSNICEGIIPNIIGVDQSCGMLTIKLKECRTTKDYLKLDKVIKTLVPTGTLGRKEITSFIPESLIENVKKLNKDYLRRNFDEDLRKIGSLGGGNHFISLEKGKSGLYLIIHSGSRDFGNRLAMHFQRIAIEKNCYNDGYLKNLSYLTGKNVELYLEQAKICSEYAHYNRKIIAKEILNNMNWNAEQTFETVHNYIDDDGIIRKGAISAQNGEKVLIPLNMADGSLICMGKGISDWNNSAPHGAGRVFSRTQAKEILTMKEYKERMKGVHSCCISTGTLDEAPMAYKDGEEIISEIMPTVEIIDRLKPVYNYKAI